RERTILPAYLTHSARTALRRSRPADLTSARPCSTQERITRQLGLRQHNVRHHYRTASCIAHTVRNSSSFHRDLPAHSAAALGTALPKIVCAPGRDHLRLLHLRAARRGPRSSCRR